MVAGPTDLIESLVSEKGTIVLLGAIDAGKTSFGLKVANLAVTNGLKVAYVDADIDQSTIGPPTCVGLKFITENVGDPESLFEADLLGFVGATSPEGHLLELVSATYHLVTKAREQGAEIVILDTSSLVFGVESQILKFHKLELTRPDAVVGFQRGGELEPLLGIARRFLPVGVSALKVESTWPERSVEERMSYRQSKLAEYFKAPLSRWRLKTSVFMPTIPPEYDLVTLGGLVVGLEDGKGNCAGIGILEYDETEKVLRMASPVTESAKGLRLGTARLSPEGRVLGHVDLPDLFG